MQGDNQLMAQVKKTAVRDSILGAANALFTAKGYSGTTLSQIAAASRVTTSNIYNYFPSKLSILYALYEPWLDRRLEKLAADASRISDPRKRLQKILTSILRDIPSANNCFANNVLQALSTLAIGEPYSRDLLLRSERRVADMIRAALPEPVRSTLDEDRLAHLLFMAFDGFAVNYRITGLSRQTDGIVELLCDLILGEAGGKPRLRRTRTAT